MRENIDLHPKGAPVPAARTRISWAAVLGFGALGLLWPLLALLGVDAILGGLTTALVALAVPAAVWVLGAGFGGVPRPIVTLTLAGLLFGILLSVSALLLGDWPDHGPAVAIAAGVIEISRSAGLGALAGLAAHGIQRARRR